MPKFRVLTKSFINDAIVEEGVIIDYVGTPGPNLEPIDAAAAAAPAPDAAGDLARQKVAAMGGDPDAVDTAAAASIAAQAAQAALTGHTVTIDGKAVESTVAPAAAAGLV